MGDAGPTLGYVDHKRIFRTVSGMTAVYLVIFALWITWLEPHTPPGTLPYQLLALLGVFGSMLGIGMMLAGRPSKEDRKLYRNGLEGWALIEDAHTVRHTDHNSEVTELELALTVPGSEPYSGRIVFDVMPIDRRRLAVGETVSVRVDPRNRDRIMLCP